MGVGKIKVTVGIIVIFVVCCSDFGIGDSFTIGVVPSASPTEFYSQWSPTFEVYLTETLGQNLTFRIQMLNITSVFDALSKDSVDFIFASSSLYSCLDLESSGYHFLEEKANMNENC